MRALDLMTQSRAEIAVITPYKAQERLIKERIGEKKNWKIKTVDASQGKLKAANNLNNNYQLLITRELSTYELTLYCLCHSPGSEADFVVFSTVRCKPLNELKDETDKHWMMENLGHVTDSHRICVALTRARYGLVIIGEFPLCTTYSMYIHATIALQFIV